MKKFYLILSAFLFLPLVGLSAPHGILVEAVEEHNYAIDLFMRENPVISFAVTSEITQEQAQQFAENLQKWPKETLRFIEEHPKGEKIFQDILPLLRRKISVQRREIFEVEETNIILTTDTKNRCKGGVACFISDLPEVDGIKFPPVISVNPSRLDDLGYVTLHEIGHFYGLADDYLEGRDLADKEYSSDINVVQGSIMGKVGASDGKITCDDADGFIKLIDLRIAQQNGGQFLGRAHKGWKSLCPESTNYYQDNRTVTRNEYDGNGTGLVVRYKKGQVIEKGYLDPLRKETLFDLFYIAPGDVLERDPDTQRITRIRSTGRAFFYKEGDPQAVTKPRDVKFERVFTYKPHAKNEYWLNIRRLINGGVEKEVNFLFTSKGLQVAGEVSHCTDCTISDTEYKTAGESFSLDFRNYRATIRTENFQPTGATITLLGSGKYRTIVLHAQLADNAWHGLVEFKSKDQNVTSYSVDLSPELRLPEGISKGEADILKLLSGTLMDNLSYLDSFYRNFYQPMFGIKSGLTDSELRQKVGQLFGK